MKRTIVYIVVILIIGIGFAYGARLPVVDGDEDAWGTVLNTFLGVCINETGHLNATCVGLVPPAMTIPTDNVTNLISSSACSSTDKVTNVTVTSAGLSIVCSGDVIGGGGGGDAHWIDLGDLLQPNTSYADNIFVDGYINATDWSNVSILEAQIPDLAHSGGPDGIGYNLSNNSYLFGTVPLLDFDEVKLNATISALDTDTDTIITSLPFTNISGSIALSQIPGQSFLEANITDLLHTQLVTSLPFTNLTGLIGLAQIPAQTFTEANISDLLHTQLIISLPFANITGLDAHPTSFPSANITDYETPTTTLPFTNLTGLIGLAQIPAQTFTEANISDLVHTQLVTTLPFANISGSIALSQIPGQSFTEANITDLLHTQLVTILPFANITGLDAHPTSFPSANISDYETPTTTLPFANITGLDTHPTSFPAANITNLDAHPTAFPVPNLTAGTYSDGDFVFSADVNHTVNISITPPGGNNDTWIQFYDSLGACKSKMGWNGTHTIITAC